MTTRPIHAVLAFVAGIAATLLVEVALISALWPQPPPPEPPSAAELAAPYGDRGLLDAGTTRTSTGTRTTISDTLRGFDRSVWIDSNDNGLIVDQTTLTCHGGIAHVTWHIGNLEPVSQDVGIHLTARLDGEPIGSILRGSRVDIWGDEPASLHAVVPCPAGDHRLDLEIRSIHGRWGFPYVTSVGEPPSDELLVARGFVVSEVWGD